MKILTIVIVIVFLSSGCTLMAPKVKTIYVPPRQAFMLRQDVPNVDIWAMPTSGTPAAGNMTLEEGWF